jgi:hypothetical protein
LQSKRGLVNSTAEAESWHGAACVPMSRKGRIRLGPTIEERHYCNARNLLARYGVEPGPRTLDAIQLAVALGLRELGIVSVFVAADQRLCRAAEDCDFSIVDSRTQGVLIV